MHSKFTNNFFKMWATKVSAYFLSSQDLPKRSEHSSYRCNPWAWTYPWLPFDFYSLGFSFLCLVDFSRLLGFSSLGLSYLVWATRALYLRWCKMSLNILMFLLRARTSYKASEDSSIDYCSKFLLIITTATLRWWIIANITQNMLRHSMFEIH